MSIGGLISGIFGSDNEDKPVVQKDAYKVNPDAYQYGGHAGGADAAAGAASAQGQTNNAAQGSYENQQNNLYNRGNVGLDQANDSRGAQTDALGMARARATGQAPSIAQMQADRAMQQSVAAQQSQAAGARGPAGLALAQQQASGNIAANQQNIAGQSAIAAAQERLAAEQAYAGQAAGIRGADIGQAQTAFGAGAQSGQLGLGAGQLGLGYAGLANNIQQSQLAAQMNREGQTSANISGAQNTAAAVGGQNAQTNQRNGEGLFNMAGNAAGSVLALAKGGQTRGGAPYLVGEQGPEMIVPKKDGFVFTAPQTQFLLATMTPQQRRAMGGQVSGCTRADGGPVDGTSYVSPGDMTYAQAPATNPPGFAPAVTSAEQQIQDNQRIAGLGGETHEPTTGLGYLLGVNMSGLYGAKGGLGGTPENASTLGGLKSAGVQTAGNQKAEQQKADQSKAAQPDAKKAKGDAKDKGGFNPWAGTQQIGAIDTRGYVPPQLIALPARAGGGSVFGGGSPPGISLGGAALSQPGGTELLGKGGGMDVMGSLKANNDAAMQFMKSPSSTGGYAREDGGDVKAGGMTYHPDNAFKGGAEQSDRLTQHLKGAAGLVGGYLGGLMAKSPAAQAVEYVTRAAIDQPEQAAGAAVPVVVAQSAPRGVASDKTPLVVTARDAQGRPIVVDARSSPTRESKVAVSALPEVASGPVKVSADGSKTQLELSSTPSGTEEITYPPGREPSKELRYNGELEARARGGMVLARGGKRRSA